MSTKRKQKAAKKPSTALAVRPKSGLPAPIESTVERLARDKNVSVDKLERLIALQERTQDRLAKSAFDAAYEAMVLEIPSISRRGQIRNKAGDVQSRYSKFEDIQRIVKPILKQFGFTLSYRTEWPEKLTVEVVGVLTHRSGHARESRFRSEADASGGKNAIQGLGSANAYGRRYTTIDLLNIVCDGVDDDGQKTGTSRRRETRQEAPATDAAPIDPPMRHAAENEPITQPQRKRLWAITKSSGRNEEEIRGWLKRRFALDSTAKILRKDYNTICTAIEAPGTLPE